MTNNSDLPVPVSHRSKRKRIILKWLKIIIIIYCSIGIILYYTQEKFLFHPRALPYNYMYSFKDSFKEVNIQMNKNDMLNMVQFFPVSITRGVVLYFHGNMENINHYAEYASNFTRMGYQVWMPDYPGFGKSNGDLTEEKLYQVAAETYKLARSKYAGDSIIIYGKSLGTGIAAQLASRVQCRRLILESPYYSIPDLFSAYAPIYPTKSMAHFKIPTIDYLSEITAPITIFHGTDDGVIPYSRSLKLKQVLKKDDQFIPIDLGNHNDLNSFGLFHHILDSLLDR